MPALSCIRPNDLAQPLNIRSAQAGDLNRCSELLGQLAALEPVFLDDPAIRRKGLEALLAQNDAVILLACLNQKIIGMLTCQIVISTAKGGLAGLVEDVVIDQPYRGQGYGSILLNALQTWAEKKGLLRLCLLAAPDNIAAQHFYLKHHWQPGSMHAWYLGIDDE